MFESERGVPRAIRDRLTAAGWDDVALAGVSDLSWDRLPGLLEPAVGSLSFGEELELRSALAGATLRQGLSNKIAPSLLNPAPSSEIQVGAADMAPMLRRRWHPC